MATRDNLRIGDCEVYFNEVFLGQTKGGVQLTIDREFEDLVVDKYGKTPMDKALIGVQVKAKFALAEATTANLDKAIPEGRYAEFAPGGDDKLGLGTNSGYLLSTDAKTLRLHPRRNSPTNTNEDIYIFKAVSVESVELNYKVDEQRLIQITMQGLVDDTQADGELIGRVGDPLIS